MENVVYLGGTLCNLGYAYAEKWRFSDALTMFDRSIHTLEAHLRAHVDHPLAEQFLCNARDGRAEALAMAASVRKPGRLRGWFEQRLGRRATNVRRPEIVRATIRLRPTGPRPQQMASGVAWPAEAAESQAAFEQGRYEDALHLLDSFLTAHPGSAEGWFWRARILGTSGRHEDVLESLDKLLAHQPGHSAALCDKADILRYLARDTEAFEVVNLLLDSNPQNATAWCLKGLILGRFLDERGQREVFNWARNDEAIEAFDQAILLEPDYFQARLYKGQVLGNAFHSALSQAKTTQDVAGQLLSEEAANDYLRSHVAAIEGYLDRARDSFHAAAQIRPDDGAPWYEKGVLLAEFPDDYRDEAAEAFAQATQLHPDFAAAWYEWARLLAKHGSQDDARRHLRKAISADPTLRDKAKKDFPWVVMD